MTPMVKGIDAIFHGHTIVESIREYGNCIFIDTGSFLNEDGYGITMVELNDYGDTYHKYGFKDERQKRPNR